MRKGTHHTAKTKKLLSEALQGENSPMFGKHPSAETKRKNSEAHIGKHPSAETRQKMSESHKGKKLTEEHKRKIGEANTGKKRTAEFKQRISEVTSGEKNPMFGVHRYGVDAPFYGKHHSRETKELISIANIGISRGLGENNPNWRGGKSFEIYPAEFDNDLRYRVRRRDNYHCQSCEVLEVDLDRALDIHHSDGNKQNNDMANLISLCHSCHMKVEGQTGANRIQTRN